MGIGNALQQGIGKVNRALGYVLLLYLLNLAIAFVLGAVLARQLEESMGQGLVAERLVQGYDDFWYRNFDRRAQGLAETFHPTVSGIGAPFKALNALLEGRLFQVHPALLGSGLLMMALWTFAAGGLIALFQRSRGVSFFQEGARYFWRIFILVLMALVAYHLIFRFILSPLLDWLQTLNREVVDERVDFFSHLLVFLVVWLLVATVNLIFDYSKIITVTQNISLSFLAPVRAVLFLLRHPGPVFGLYFALFGFWLVALGVYWLFAPGVGQGSWGSVWLAFAGGQLYVFFRVWLRAFFWATQGSLYLAGKQLSETQTPGPVTEPGEVAV